MQKLRPENPAMTFDEFSMERSKSFVNALQELKNLRPQLYSAADCCEKSYIHSEQKQMVPDNLKDYAVQALVNAVDHLGTVAYKLNDIFEQHTSDVSTLERKLSCLNLKILTCQIYTDKESFKQQQQLAFIPRHHKHYIFPVNKKVKFSPQIQIDAQQNHILARPCIHPSGTPSSKTLSWHLASETKSTLNGTQNALMGTEGPKATGTTPGVFQLLDADVAVTSKSSASRLRTAGGAPASGAVVQKFGVTQRDFLEGSKQLAAFKSFDNAGRREIVRAPARSKSMLSAFFIKHKSMKLPLEFSRYLYELLFARIWAEKSPLSRGHGLEASSSSDLLHRSSKAPQPDCSSPLFLLGTSSLGSWDSACGRKPLYYRRSLRLFEVQRFE
ncbi:hypothetical protein NE237_028780 [Protea cynaroides]|uniref:Protein ABIL1 n=1 Tax=Protea cynaroides TaxID=273540 RepID=A0A9Q0JVL4_9MAGN|nr:hypothetical protein NE237_028780 [Protea cynaroides]